jgi:hypothetical protein
MWDCSRRRDVPNSGIDARHVARVTAAPRRLEDAATIVLAGVGAAVSSRLSLSWFARIGHRSPPCACRRSSSPRTGPGPTCCCLSWRSCRGCVVTARRPRSTTRFPTESERRWSGADRRRRDLVRRPKPAKNYGTIENDAKPTPRPGPEGSIPRRILGKIPPHGVVGHDAHLVNDPGKIRTPVMDRMRPATRNLRITSVAESAVRTRWSTRQRARAASRRPPTLRIHRAESGQRMGR